MKCWISIQGFHNLLVRPSSSHQPFSFSFRSKSKEIRTLTKSDRNFLWTCQLQFSRLMDTSSKCHDLFLSLTFLAWSRWGPAPYDHFGTFQESVTKPENHETNILCSSMWHSLANLLCFTRFWARRVMSTIFENYMAICKRRLISAKTQISTRTCTHHSYIPWSR